MVNHTLTLHPTLISYPMNLVSSMNTIKNLNNMIVRKIYGSLNQQMQLKVEELQLLTILMMSMLMNCLLYVDTLQIHFWLTAISLIYVYTSSWLVMSLSEFIFSKKVWQDLQVRLILQKLIKTINTCILQTTRSTRKMRNL